MAKFSMHFSAKKRKLVAFFCKKTSKTGVYSRASVVRVHNAPIMHARSAHTRATPAGARKHRTQITYISTATRLRRFPFLPHNINHKQVISWYYFTPTK